MQISIYSAILVVQELPNTTKINIFVKYFKKNAQNFDTS